MLSPRPFRLRRVSRPGIIRMRLAQLKKASSAMLCRRRRPKEMIYQVHILKKTHASGASQTIEKRTHTASSDDEAIRTAKENLRHSAPPTASGFSLMRQDGKEICRWFKTDADGPDHSTPR